MKIPIIAALIAFIIFIIYSIFIHHFAIETKWDWWNNFIATVLSVVIGISVSVALFNYQNKLAGNERKDQLVVLIKAEFIKDYIESLGKQAEEQVD